MQLIDPSVHADPRLSLLASAQPLQARAQLMQALPAKQNLQLHSFVHNIVQGGLCYLSTHASQIYHQDRYNARAI